MTKNARVALVFGESDSDRSALIELVVAIRPDASQIEFRKRRDPPVYLRKSERSDTRRKSASAIAGLVSAAQVTSDVAFVITHQDCDAVEPAHVEATESACKELHDAGLSSVIVATPAFEIETWWMLFPNEVKKVQPLWRSIDYGDQNVGLIRDAKNRLKSDLRPVNGVERSKCRDYQEADSVAIAKKIRETGAALRKQKAISNSFESFKALVKSLNLSSS